MSVLAGPFAIATVLLAVGGAAKAVRPRDTAQALTAVGVKLPRLLPARLVVRVGGGVEAIIGIAALLFGGPMLCLLVALSYLAFAAFVLVALRSGAPISSCGCFGKVDTPPSVVHVVVDLAFAGVAAGAAIVGEVALPDVLVDQPLLGIPFLLLLVIGCALVFLAFTSLPKTMAVVREVAACSAPPSGSKGIALTNWLVNKAAGVLERKSSRRGFLIGSAMAGSAVAVAGCLPAVKPGSTYAHITDCGGGLCTDGYTEFCCTINDGFNACPPGSFAGGWWRADFSSFCNGTRYYIDCMQDCCGPNLGNGFCAGCSECRCAGDCNTRRVYCNYFRYGQCHQEIGITGPIACRVVTCTPPYQDASMACSTVLAVDNSTAEHAPAAPCAPKTISLASAANGAVVTAGRIAVFARFSDSFIWTRQWDGAGWAGWSKVPPAVSSGVSSASNSSGLYVVGRGVDNQVRYNRLLNGAWTGEGILPGVVPASDPELVASAGSVHVFVRATDRTVRHGTFTNGSWSGWSNLGGAATSNLAATASNWGLFVFVRDSNYGLAVNRLNGGTWSGWQSLGGSVLGDPAAAADSSSVYVFAQQAGRQVWYRGYLNGSWGVWSNLGGDVASDPVATVGPDGVYVFVRGADGKSYLNRLSRFAWSGFQTLYGSFDSNIDAVGDSSGVYAFGRGSDGALWTGRHVNGTFSGWSSLGGTIAPIDGVG